ncbi:Na(+)/H(+) antiporter subunit D [soil metagenome]|jgi:multicomponent Na+:H+ antiporter subunit D|nr:Na(+)/H(+) antiporter subunit D [Gemmatimonadota bacterium]
MNSALLHPVLPFVLAAAMAPFVGVQLRRLLSLAAPLTALVLLGLLPLGTQLSFMAMGHEWVYLRFDDLSRIFALAFILYAFIAGVYAWTDVERGPKAASLGLAGAGVGVVLAGDLVSLFFFWEWLTITSLFLIWYGHTAGAWAAGFRYLMFHLAGAVVMLIGILLQLAEGGGPFVPLSMESISAWLILLGMVTNAAVPPLHAWLSDAYPRASVYGTVFLAAFTTKAAVYALARGFPGLDVLVWAGVAMALFGVVYAVLENDIRRLLAYHIISQVGYMVTGIGLGTALALNGTAAHAFAHIFYKGLLMMSAGAVIYATGRGKLTELGQLARPLKWTLVLMMIGAFSISGVPFFNGFVSKSMIVSAAADAGRGPIELLLLLASMGTFLHTGLKLPWFTFFARDQGARVLRPVPASMYLGMGLTAAVCIVTGVFPGATLYAVLPYAAQYNPFTAHHFLEALQILTGTALGFWILRVKLFSEPTTTIDVDFLYRQPVLWLVDGAGAVLEGVGQRTNTTLAAAVHAGWRRLIRIQERGVSASLAFQAAVVFLGVAFAAYVALLIHQ